MHLPIVRSQKEKKHFISHLINYKADSAGYLIEVGFVVAAWNIRSIIGQKLCSNKNSNQVPAI